MTKTPDLIPINDDEIPTVELTGNLVYKLASIGTPIDEISAWTEVTEDEITERFGAVLKRAYAKHNINVRLSVNYSNLRGSPLILNKTNEKLGTKKIEVNEMAGWTMDELRNYIRAAAERYGIGIGDGDEAS